MSRNVSKRLMLSSHRLDKEKKYWEDILSGQLVSCRFPYDSMYSFDALNHHEIEVYPFQLPVNLYDRLTQLSNNSSHNMFMVLLAAVVGILNKHTGQRDIITAFPMFKQNIEGEFLNTVIVIRTQLIGTITFRELVLQVKKSVMEANENVNYPLEELQHNLELPTDGTNFSLFESVVLLEDIHERYYLEGIAPNFLFSFHRSEKTLEGDVQYNSLLYKRETVEKITNRFIDFLKQAVEDPGNQIIDLTILSEDERREILEKFNYTATGYPGGKTVAQLFHQQVAKTPFYITDVYENHQLSWEELNKKAGQLARLLEKNGVKPRGILGIMAEPSIERMIGLVAILKTGSAYLPIDSDFPEGRIIYMLKDCQVDLLLTQRHLIDKIPSSGSIIDLDDPGIFDMADPGPLPTGNPTDAIYVIYTSGTSGKPKGVLIQNENIINYVTWFSNEARLTGKDKTTLSSSFALDLGYTSIYPSLLKGSQLHLLAKETYYDIEKFLDYILDNRISYIKLTPSLFSLMVNNPGFSRETFKNLRLVVLGGEAINLTDVERLHMMCHHVQVMNHYGPTEATIGCIAQFLDFNRFEEYKRNPTIGKPIYNTRVYILDANSNLLPVGVPGELAVSGAGLGRGYLNRPELTAEKFNSDSYRSYRSYRPYIPKKIYRTGDLARWLSDGNIEFLGRIDQQVKIRGFRVEPGEIENQLLKHTAIKEAVVLAREDGKSNKYLCAYMVLDTNVPVSELRGFISNRLPDYMVPSYFVPVERIPLTFNGKVDRKALPEPEISVLVGEYAAPRDEMEKKLVEICSEVLEIENEQLGIEHNFFELGGHSLNATILMAKLHKAFNVNVPMTALFEKPIIRDLAQYIKKEAPGEKFVSIRPAEKKEYYALSSAQSRLYILQQMDLTATAYNITEAVELEMALEREALEKTFRQLIHRHESLRTSFEFIGNQVVQRVHQQVEFAIRYHDLVGRSLDISSFIGHFIRPFDLSRSPLIRVELAKIKPMQYVMMVDIHHIVSDGISHRILIKDFYSLNQAGELPGLRLQYKDYAEWQQYREVKEALQLQEKYWLDEFQGLVPVLDLPIDFPRPALQSFEGSTLTFELRKEETKALNEIARSNGATLFMVLLAVQNIFLSKLSSQEDIIVGTPIAGRRHADLEQIVGMFVNTLALRNYPSTGKTFTTLLQEVKTRTLQAFENQDCQFEDLVDQLELERNLSRNPLFDVEFILQNIRRETREILPENEEQEEINIRDQTYVHRTTQFDLALVGYEGDERLIFMFVYCTRLFKEDTILRFSQFFKHIIWSIIENPGKKIMEIAIITEEEKNRLLYDFNDTEAEYPKDKTIHELFADQVEKTPNRTASIGNCQCSIVNSQLSTKGEGHLSYKDLDKRCGQLAWLLIEKGVKPGTIVGIMVDRSIEMIVGIFGIVKAGGAYLPLDHEYPEARIKYIVEKSGTNVVITRKNLIDKGKDVVFTGEIIDIFHEHLSNEILDDEKDKGARKVYPPDPAYVIYTSGSTGNPKGVVIQHQNVVNFITGMAAVIDFLPGKSILAVTTISFDIFFLETLLPLTRGLKVVIAGEDHQKDPALLEQLILKNRINMVQFTPSRLQLLLNLRGNLQGLSGVEQLMVGGEAFPSPLLEKVKEHFHGKIYNMYGPTETTIWSAVKELTHTLPGEITIGTPIANTQVYIVNRNNHLQPLGVNGELWIGGDGVASGYLNNVELTAEKFCLRRPGGALFEKTAPPGPPCKNFLFEGTRGLAPLFLKVPGKNHMQSCNHASLPSSHHPSIPIPHSPYSPIYRTGDLARWLSNREIEFLGRLDLQVKIRGFRIELEEIEEQLLKHDGIKEAVVMMKSDPTGHNYLCAYMVPQPDDSYGPPDTPVLRENLSVNLPSYMIPAYFVYLEKMPLTPNGKIDRKALPSPEIKAGQDYIAPRTETEKKLLEIWAEILLIEKHVISIDSNFFRLGGQSLRATIMVNKIHKEFGVETSLADIFQTPTIERIAAVINAIKWVENKKETSNQEREEIIL